MRGTPTSSSLATNSTTKTKARNNSSPCGQTVHKSASKPNKRKARETATKNKTTTSPNKHKGKRHTIDKLSALDYNGLVRVKARTLKTKSKTKGKSKHIAYAPRTIGTRDTRESGSAGQRVPPIKPKHNGCDCVAGVLTSPLRLPCLIH